MKRKKLILILVTAAALLLMTWPAQAAENIQATITADQSELTVGDPVGLRLRLSIRPDTR